MSHATKSFTQNLQQNHSQQILICSVTGYYKLKAFPVQKIVYLGLLLLISLMYRLCKYIQVYKYRRFGLSFAEYFFSSLFLNRKFFTLPLACLSKISITESSNSFAEIKWGEQCYPWYWGKCPSFRAPARRIRQRSQEDYARYGPTDGLHWTAVFAALRQH